MAKTNWASGTVDAEHAAGLYGRDESKTDKLEKDHPYWDGKASPDEKKTYTLMDGAPHLRPDAKLDAYIADVAADYAEDYDEHWGPLFHAEEGEIDYAEGVKKLTGRK